jgi:hypothetical protein
MRLTAIQLKAGDRVLSCPNHPTLRGTVQVVNFYNRPQAVLEATGTGYGAKPNWQGATILAHDTVGKVLSVKAPPSAKTARTAAKAVEQCYREGAEVERVSVRVAGYPSVTLNPTDVVDVWLPSTEAA